MTLATTSAQSVPASTSWPDRLGIWTSTLCFVHCLLTPLLLSFSAVFAHFMPSEEHAHRSLAVVVAALGAMALVNGFRTHRRRRVLALMVCGLVCIFGGAWFGDLLPSHALEIGITFLGSTLMISAHRLNHTFCKSCVCAVPHCGVVASPEHE